MSLKIIVGILLSATIAAQVAVSFSSAVNELLLGEGEELIRLDVVDTLKSTSRGERPT